MIWGDLTRCCHKYTKGLSLLVLSLSIVELTDEEVAAVLELAVCGGKLLTSLLILNSSLVNGLEHLEKLSLAHLSKSQLCGKFARMRRM